MISKFERKFGKYAIKNLTLYLIIGYVIGYLISLFSPELYTLLNFNPYMIFKGQVWRVVTWVITAPEDLGVLVIVMLFLYYSLGQTLEKTWGTYRYNVYIFSGLLYTVVGALILYIVMCAYYGSYIPAELIGTNIGLYVSTYYINMSIFLAAAVTYPDMELLLYFIVPIKIKWFGLIYGIMIVYDIFNAFKTARMIGIYMNAIILTVLIILSLLNFIIYFFTVKNRGRFAPKQVKRRQQFKQNIKRSAPKTYEGGARHKCAVCGQTELDNPDLIFRYCSKCSGNKEYCQEHLFTHTHN